MIRHFLHVEVECDGPVIRDSGKSQLGYKLKQEARADRMTPDEADVFLAKLGRNKDERVELNEQEFMSKYADLCICKKP